MKGYVMKQNDIDFFALNAEEYAALADKEDGIYYIVEYKDWDKSLIIVDKNIVGYAAANYDVTWLDDFANGRWDLAGLDNIMTVIDQLSIDSSKNALVEIDDGDMVVEEEEDTEMTAAQLVADELEES